MKLNPENLMLKNIIEIEKSFKEMTQQKNFSKLLLIYQIRGLSHEINMTL